MHDSNRWEMVYGKIKNIIASKMGTAFNTKLVEAAKSKPKLSKHMIRNRRQTHTEKYVSKCA